MAKKFFYICAGLLLLTLSYLLGAERAVAQAPSNPVVAASGDNVFTANGDWYKQTTAGGGYVYFRAGNIFDAFPPTEAEKGSFGALKARYRN